MLMPAATIVGMLGARGAPVPFNPVLRSTLSSTADTTSYAASAFTPPANSLLVAFVEATATLAGGSMSGGGLTWVQRHSIEFGAASQHTLYMFVADVGASPSSTTPTFDCTGDAATGCCIHVYSIEGVQQANIDESIENSGVGVTSDPSTGAFVSSNVTQMMLAAFATATATPTGQGAPSGWTGFTETGQATPSAVLGSAYKNTGESATTITFVGTDVADWACVGIQINPG